MRLVLNVEVKFLIQKKVEKIEKNDESQIIHRNSANSDELTSNDLSR